MPFVEYILLALLGSTGAAATGATPVSPSTGTLGADAVVQPAGGAVGEGDFKSGSGLFAQCTGGDKSIKGLAHHGGGKKILMRRHRTGHRRGKHQGTTSSVNRRREGKGKH